MGKVKSLLGAIGITAIMLLVIFMMPVLLVLSTMFAIGAAAYYTIEDHRQYEARLRQHKSNAEEPID